jgi:hypothetical protein
VLPDRGQPRAWAEPALFLAPTTSLYHPDLMPGKLLTAPRNCSVSHQGLWHRPGTCHLGAAGLQSMHSPLPAMLSFTVTGPMGQCKWQTAQPW